MGAVLILVEEEEEEKKQPPLTLSDVDGAPWANSDSDVELFSRVRHFSLSLPA